MSNKGISLSAITRYKISIAKQKDRTKILKRLQEYIETLEISARTKEKKTIPSLVSASLYAGISKKALLAWELTTAEDSEVRVLLDHIRDLEEQYLREQGLRGLTDSKITTLLLKADHNIAEKPANLTQNNTFNVSPEILAEAIALTRNNKE